MVVRFAFALFALILFCVTSSEGFVRLRLGLYIPVGGSRRGGSSSTTLKPLVPSGDGKYRRNRKSDVLAHGHNATEFSDPYSSAEKYLLDPVVCYNTTRGGYFSCPPETRWCCGDRNDEYCCTYWQGRRRRVRSTAALSVSAVVVLLVALLALIYHFKLVEKCKQTLRRHRERILVSYQRFR